MKEFVRANDYYVLWMFKIKKIFDLEDEYLYFYFRHMKVANFNLKVHKNGG